MGRYAVTHVPGLEPYAAQWLARAGATSVLSAEGLAIFTSPHKKLDFPWASNVYTVLDEGRASSVDEWLAWLCRHPGWAARMEKHASEQKTFRVMPMHKGVLVKASPKALQALENAVQQATGWEPYRAKPDVELWAVVRGDGLAVFMMRLTRRREDEPAGSLSADFCAALAAIAGVTRGSRALDPFAGRGGIARAMAQRGAEVFCGDRGDAMAHELAMLARRAPSVKASRWNAFEHPWEAGSFGAVVTDPPWGLYEALEYPVKDYAARLAGICDHALAKDGTAVILWSREDALRAALIAKGFSVTRCDVLVHGKKAAVWVAYRS